MQGEQVTPAQKTQTAHGFQGRNFYRQNFRGRAAGCVTLLWLAGGEVTGWCSRNLQSVWGPHACAQPEVTILYLGWGGYLVPIEELKDMYQIVMHNPFSFLQRTRTSSLCCFCIFSVS